MMHGHEKSVHEERLVATGMADPVDDLFATKFLQIEKRGPEARVSSNTWRAPCVLRDLRGPPVPEGL